VIVLAVTARTIAHSSTPIDVDSAEALVDFGGDRLPDSLGKKLLPPGGRCLALIYEFEGPSPSDSVEFVRASAITAAQHLSGAKMWSASGLEGK
jgi:hypothetical protein